MAGSMHSLKTTETTAPKIQTGVWLIRLLHHSDAVAHEIERHENDKAFDC